jgi:hypothetical protein
MAGDGEAGDCRGVVRVRLVGLDGRQVKGRERQSGIQLAQALRRRSCPAAGLSVPQLIPVMINRNRTVLPHNHSWPRGISRYRSLVANLYTPCAFQKNFVTPLPVLRRRSFAVPHFQPVLLFALPLSGGCLRVQCGALPGRRWDLAASAQQDMPGLLTTPGQTGPRARAPVDVASLPSSACAGPPV